MSFTIVGSVLNVYIFHPIDPFEGQLSHSSSDLDLPIILGNVTEFSKFREQLEKSTRYIDIF